MLATPVAGLSPWVQNQALSRKKSKICEALINGVVSWEHPCIIMYTFCCYMQVFSKRKILNTFVWAHCDMLNPSLMPATDLYPAVIKRRWLMIHPPYKESFMCFANHLFPSSSWPSSPRLQVNTTQQRSARQMFSSSPSTAVDWMSTKPSLDKFVGSNVSIVTVQITVGAEQIGERMPLWGQDFAQGKQRETT